MVRSLRLLFTSQLTPRRTGFTAWPGMRPQNLTPIFSFAKTSLHSDLLLTPLEQYWDKERYDPPWEQKVNNKAIWRGSTTGVWFDRGTWWRSSQRVRLYFMSQDKIGVQSVRFDGVGQESAKGVESIAERKVSTEILMNRYLDFAFSGKAGQCTEIDGSCDAVKRLIKFVPTIGWGEANDFKYLLDLDGNAWSGRFHRLLSSNAAIIKSTIFPEWCVVLSSSQLVVDADRFPFVGTLDGFSLGCSTSILSLSPHPR